jgi:hypothetical protein
VKKHFNLLQHLATWQLSIHLKKICLNSVCRILAILIQIIAVVINTALVDELVALLDDNIPLAHVTLVRLKAYYLLIGKFLKKTVC